ncbi:MAG: TPM domain-containing protein, partial [Alphaproteobacteria bacterium]
AVKTATSSSAVIDNAALLSAEALKRLRGLTAGVDYGTGYQFVAIVEPSVSKEGIAADAAKLVLNRSIGAAGKPGALLLVAVKQKQAWIVAGPGLETVLPPTLRQAILSRIILPNFKLNKIERGTVDGARAVIMALQGAYSTPLSVSAAAPAPAAADWLPLGVAAAFLLGAMGSALPMMGTTVVVIGGLGRVTGRW